MALTIDQHLDLKTRLEALVGEFAPASDLDKAKGKLADVLERLPIGEDAGSGISEADAKASVDEIDRRGQVIADLQMAKKAVEDELAATKQQLADAQAALEAARQATAPATPAADGNQ